MTTITIGHAVLRARGHLVRLHLRAALRRHLALVFGVGAVAAGLRPFLWPLHAQPSWHAVVRAIVLAAGAGGLVGFALLARAWRSRPTSLASARRVDAALALEEVVASGWSFERDARDGAVVALARGRALAALHGVDVRRLLRPCRIERTRLARNVLRLATVGIVGAMLFGGVDRLVVARFRRPVTPAERVAAAELRRAAAALDEEALSKQAEKDDPKRAAAEAARKAAAATERGDRQAAMDALDEMRNAQRTAEANEREQARELRALKDALDGRDAKSGDGAPSTADRSASAADALAKLGKKDPAEVKALAERLGKAEAAARAAAKAASAGEGGKAGVKGATASAWERAAAALAEARAATERGDPAAAKAAMERAEKEISALEKQHGASSMQTLARASASASSLDRSLQAGASGAKPGPGKAGETDGKDGAGGKDGADGKGKPGAKPGEGGPSRGGGPGDRTPGQASPERPAVTGDLQARADVKEGEKAAGVIDGMGKGGDPKDYRAIFPAYDTAVEDGLREELVPAARRPAVRRYFESIRPNDNGEKP